MVPHLREQPHGEQRQPRVLAAEPVVVGVEDKVVEVEEPEPVFPRDGRVAADGVVLVGDPHDQDDVEGGRRVLEELGHDGLHA